MSANATFTPPVAEFPHKLGPEVRAAVKAAWGNSCAYCRSAEVEHVDHVFPKARGGADCLANYAGACAPCNLRKSDKMMPDAFLGIVLAEVRAKLPAVQAELQRMRMRSEERKAGKTGPKGPKKTSPIQYHRFSVPLLEEDISALSLEAFKGEGYIPKDAIDGDLSDWLDEASKDSRKIVQGPFTPDHLCADEGDHWRVTGRLIEIAATRLHVKSSDFELRLTRKFDLSRPSIRKADLGEKTFALITNEFPHEAIKILMEGRWSNEEGLAGVTDLTGKYPKSYQEPYFYDEIHLARPQAEAFDRLTGGRAFCRVALKCDTRLCMFSNLLRETRESEDATVYHVSPAFRPAIAHFLETGSNRMLAPISWLKGTNDIRIDPGLYFPMPDPSSFEYRSLKATDRILVKRGRMELEQLPEL